MPVFTGKTAVVAIIIAGFHVNDDLRFIPSTLYIFLKMLAHVMRFFHAEMLGHHQMQVDMPLVTCLTRAQLVKADHLSAEMFGDSGAYLVLFAFW